MNKASFNRNVWLLNTIFQAGLEGITFEEICEKWQKSGMSDGKGYPLRSFHNHRNEIRETFNVNIACKKSTNAYFISGNSLSKNLVAKIIGLISLSQVIDHESKKQSNISLNLTAGGEGFLPLISQAIQNRQLTHITLSSTDTTHDTEFYHFKTLGIKNYKENWYILGEKGNTEFVMLNLRQIKSFDIEGGLFTMPDTNLIQELLVENYGDCIESIPTEEITFRVPAQVAKQLTNHPIHVSQQLIENKKSFAIFYLNLKPTQAFIHDILSYGPEVAILTPNNLKEKISSEAKRIARKNA